MFTYEQNTAINNKVLKNIKMKFHGRPWCSRSFKGKDQTWITPHEGFVRNVALSKYESNTLHKQQFYNNKIDNMSAKWSVELNKTQDKSQGWKYWLQDKKLYKLTKHLTSSLET